MATEFEVGELSADEKALVEAAKQGDAQRVGELIGKGTKVNCKAHGLSTEWDLTPLMFAAEQGHLEAVRMLLAAGANVAAVTQAIGEDGGGGTQALHYAARNKQHAVMEALLDAGADVNAVGGNGRTPLSSAVYANDLDGIRLLLKRGANAKFKPKKGKCDPPLCAAASLVNNTVSLVRHEGKMVFQSEPLWARKSEIFDLYNILLAAGADPDAVNPVGWTPLMGLAHGAEMPDEVRLPLIERLLKSGAKVNVSNRQGNTALSLAVLYNNPNVARALCQTGADVNVLFSTGSTLLDRVEKNLEDYKKRLNEAPNSRMSEEQQKQLREVQEDKARRAAELLAVLQEFKAKHASELSAPAGAAEKQESVPPIKFGAAHFLKFINDGEPDWALAAVEAPIKKVAESFARISGAKNWERDVPLRGATEEHDEPARLAAVVQVEENEWTVIYHSLYYSDEAGMTGVTVAARTLSKELKTKAISFVGNDGAMGYDLFKGGKLVERAVWEEGAGFSSFESTARKKPELESVDEKFADEIFRGQEIYLPACYPKSKGKRNLLMVDKLSAERIQRADLMAL